MFRANIFELQENHAALTPPMVLLVMRRRFGFFAYQENRLD